MTHIIVALAVVLVTATTAAAQDPTVVTQYRLTRVAPGPPATSILQKSAMVCSLAKLPLPASVGFRIDDPLNSASDCEYLGNPNGIIQPRTPGVSHSYTIAGGNAQGEYGPESLPGVVGVPAPPSAPRVRPPAAAGVVVDGAVLQRFPWSGLDVAQFTVAGVVPVYVGTPVLAVPGYEVRPGDFVSVAFWR